MSMGPPIGGYVQPPNSPRASFMAPRSPRAPSFEPPRRRYEYVPPKPKTRSRDYRSTYQVGYADYMQPEFKLTVSHPQFKVDPENLKKPGGMKTPRERTLEQMSMDPQQIAADLKKLTQHSDIFHKHAPMEGHYETVLAAAGQREGSKRLPGDNRPQWRSA